MAAAESVVIRALFEIKIGMPAKIIRAKAALSKEWSCFEKKNIKIENKRVQIKKVKTLAVFNMVLALFVLLKINKS